MRPMHHNLYRIKREYWELWGATEEIHTVEYNDLIALSAVWNVPIATLLETLEELPDPREQEPPPVKLE